LERGERTIHAGRYSSSASAAGHSSYPIQDGERTLLDQCLATIANARRTIYLENQYLAVAVVVVALIPATTIASKPLSNPGSSGAFAVSERLSRFETFREPASI